MNTSQQRDRTPIHRNRFNRIGAVITERRRFCPYIGTDDYREGWPIFTPRKSSPAREAYHARRVAARKTVRAA